MWWMSFDEEYACDKRKNGPSAPSWLLCTFKLNVPNLHTYLDFETRRKRKACKRDGDRLGFPVCPTEWTNPETKEISLGYREGGYFSDAFTNMLAFLGWNPGTTQEIFSLDDLIEAFSLERVGKAGAKFDFDKTKWFNQQYLRAKTGKELSNLVAPFAEEKEIDKSYLSDVCELMKERATFPKDIWEESQFFFSAPHSYDEKTVRKKWKDQTPSILQELSSVLNGIEDFSAKKIEESFKAFLAEKELSFGVVLPNFRVAVTGLGVGPSMFQISALLGKEEVLVRIQTAIDKIQK